MRNSAKVIFFLLFILSFHLPCSAGITDEIASLLNFVEKSDCAFIRNGKEYDSVASRRHIENKYNYFKDKIITTEDFIRYSATKSTITGKSYKVICNGVAMNSSDWLNRELERLRKR